MQNNGKKEIENKFRELEQRIEKLEDKTKNLSTDNLNSSLFSNELIKRIATKIDQIPTKELVIISLKILPNQTTSSLQENLKKWGCAEDTFFLKNFSTVLFKNGIIQKSGKDEHKAILYSLTAKGEFEYEKIIQKRELN